MQAFHGDPAQPIVDPSHAPPPDTSVSGAIPSLEKGAPSFFQERKTHQGMAAVIAPPCSGIGRDRPLQLSYAAFGLQLAAAPAEVGAGEPEGGRERCVAVDRGDNHHLRRPPSAATRHTDHRCRVETLPLPLLSFHTVPVRQRRQGEKKGGTPPLWYHRAPRQRRGATFCCHASLRPYRLPCC